MNPFWKLFDSLFTLFKFRILYYFYKFFLTQEDVGLKQEDKV